MTPSLGVNLRVTGHCNQGGRKYMEGDHSYCHLMNDQIENNIYLHWYSISINVIILDVFSVAYQQTNDEKDLEYAFFGIFDGHGGREAAQYSKVCSNKQKISYN